MRDGAFLQVSFRMRRYLFYLRAIYKHEMDEEGGRKEMSLIKCIECGKEFSSYASACPNCACPTSVVLKILSREMDTLPASTDAKDNEAAPLDLLADDSAKEREISFESVPAPEDVVPVAARVSDPNGAYYGVPKSLDPVTFYRDALLDMVRDTGTPPDVFSSSFDSAIESKKHLAAITGSVVGSYSAEVGFDRTRTKTEYSGGRTRQRRENYIEWQPISGTYEGDQVVPMSLDDDPLDEDIELAYITAVTRYDVESQQIPTDDVITPSRETISAAMTKCEERAKRECEKGLPGQHSRSFSFSGTASLKEYTCHTIPAYSIPFTYRGGQYRKSYFAMKDHEGASFGKIPEISDEIHSRVDKKLRPLGIVALVFLSLSIAVSLVFAALHEYIYREIGLSVSLPVFGVGVLTTIAYWISHRVYRNSIIRANLIAKARAVEGVLSEKGLAPLSEEEKVQFFGRKSK